MDQPDRFIQFYVYAMDDGRMNENDKKNEQASEKAERVSEQASDIVAV